jgi:hypothetical protein
MGRFAAPVSTSSVLATIVLRWFGALALIANSCFWEIADAVCGYHSLNVFL